MRAIIVVILGMAVCAGAARAWAQEGDSGDEVAAEQLFVEGRALMQRAQYEAACPKLQASFDLDPASGTQINLARCYEELGRLATAWRHYREASDRAVRDGNTARAQVARKLAAELEPRLPRLVITVRAAEVPELVVRRDGVSVPAALLGTPVYVDPGAHEVTATAPGRAPFSATFTAVEATTSTVEVPVLAPAAPAVSGAPVPPAPDRVLAPGAPGVRPGPGAAPAAGVSDRGGPTPGPADRVDARRAAPRSGARHRRVAGLVTGGAGLAVLGLGLGLGGAAYGTWNDAFDSGACDRVTLRCTVEGKEQVEVARGRARLSTVASGLGVAAVVTGAVLYVTAPRVSGGAGDRRAARLVPWAGGGDVGVAITGGF
jgi:hypothetical protein